MNSQASNEKSEIDKIISFMETFNVPEEYKVRLHQQITQEGIDKC